MKAPAPEPGRFSSSFIERSLSSLVLVSGILLSVYMISNKTAIVKNEIVDYCRSVQKIIISNDYTLQDFHSLDSSKTAILQSQLNACFTTFHFSPDLIYDFKTLSLLIKTRDSVICISNTSVPDSEKRSLASASAKIINQSLPAPVFLFPFSLNPNSFGSVHYPFSQYNNTIVLALTITSSEWYLEILTVLIFPLAITVFLLFLISCFSRIKKTKKQYSDILFPEVFVTVITGLLVTLEMSTISFMHENNTRLKSFNQLSVSILTPVFNELSDVKNLRFEGFNRFFENSEHVERSEFYDYASYLSSDKNIKAWGFISVADTSILRIINYAIQHNPGLCNSAVSI
jgi:hypothetical protein